MNQEITVIRKAKKDNYTIVSNEYIRNVNLSWKAKGLMTYLLHLPPTWKINTKHLEKQATDGRHSLKKALQELQEHGYLSHENIREKGKFSGHIWHIYEEPIKYFKQPQAENPHAVNPHAVNPPLLNTKDSESKDSEYIVKTKDISCATKVALSADADDLTSFFVEKLKERKPDIKIPENLDRWILEIDRMIRMDKRDPNKIKAMIEWIHRDSFWSTNILSTKKLRDQFDQIELQIKAKSAQGNVQKNKAWVQRNKQKYPESYKNLVLTEKFAVREGSGKEISLNLSYEDFKRAFVRMFGINYDDLSPNDK